MLFVQNAHVMTLQCLCLVVIYRDDRELKREFLCGLHLLVVFLIFDFILTPNQHSEVDEG
jgi:hypothetical protein